MEVSSKGQEKGNKRDAKRKGNQERGDALRKGGISFSPIIITAFSSQSHFFKDFFLWKYITRIELEKREAKHHNRLE